MSCGDRDWSPRICSTTDPTYKLILAFIIAARPARTGYALATTEAVRTTPDALFSHLNLSFKLWAEGKNHENNKVSTRGYTGRTGRCCTERDTKGKAGSCGGAFFRGL